MSINVEKIDDELIMIDVGANGNDSPIHAEVNYVNSTNDIPSIEEFSLNRELEKEVHDIFITLKAECELSEAINLMKEYLEKGFWVKDSEWPPKIVWRVLMLTKEQEKFFKYIIRNFLENIGN